MLGFQSGRKAGRKLVTKGIQGDSLNWGTGRKMLDVVAVDS
jgi:hypothetical protein